MHYKKSFRPAIAMIELIFSIVIMGIVLMSAPMLISTATQSTYVALQQEGINEAASRVNMIMGYAWDENNTNTDYVPPILHVTAGHADLNVSGTTARRQGTPSQSQRTYIASDANTSNFFASPLGPDGGDADDVDDFIGDINLTNIQDAAVDYTEKETININTAVAYANDTPNAGGYNQQTITLTPFNADGTTNAAVGSSNIKTITVTLTSTHADTEAFAKNIVLRAFSCNIGSYEFEKRSE